MGVTSKEALVLPSETREINGRKYTVNRLGWWDLLAQLSEAEAVLGPAILGIVKGDFSAADARFLLTMPAEQLVSAMLSAVRSVAGKDGRELMLAMGKQTVVSDGDKRRRLDADSMNRWFGRYPGDALLWLAFCLEVQFADFFVTPGSALMKWAESKGLTTGPDESPASEETDDELTSQND